MTLRDVRETGLDILRHFSQKNAIYLLKREKKISIIETPGLKLFSGRRVEIFCAIMS